MLAKAGCSMIKSVLFVSTKFSPDQGATDRGPVFTINVVTLHTEVRVTIDRLKLIHLKNLKWTIHFITPAFDRISRKLVLQSLQSQEVIEMYIDSMRDMYQDVTTQIRGTADVIQPFMVEVGEDQGSALSPLI
ncbi:hypothetical protein EVAR_6440_1 [Eumeta japonica]|uniref:Uncharacterized protein n=1 Tax=Eumeta variegata TaxID=151549 RepID=A0A4C1TDR2_EUMVA|nr:hypothetical protein EVAR_6440_1 [Eumeta japonica]